MNRGRGFPPASFFSNNRNGVAAVECSNAELGGTALDYAQALEYIHSLGRFGIKPGLERMQTALHLLGDPHKKLRAVHVAGTNGKGSTASMIASVLRASGLRVGLFTSPHLSDYCERIVVDSEPIRHEALAGLIEELIPVIDRTVAVEGPMTEFEVSTLAAFTYFARQNLDACVIEVGMGGRLDSTNVLDPVVSVIAPVAMDHMDRLGDTLALIAGEKAGIIKPGRPAVVGPQEDEARDVIRDRGVSVGAPVYWYGDDFRAHDVSVGPDGTFCSIDGLNQVHQNLRINLIGRHQAYNGALALAACEVFARECAISGLEVRRGFDRVTWPGRFEVFSGPPIVVLDGAHNPHGVGALAATLRDVFPGRRVTFVMGILDNRPVEEMVAMLAPIMKCLYATSAAYAGSAPSERLVQAARSAGVPARSVCGAASALQRAIDDCDGQDVICACGSLYFIGEIRPSQVGRKTC